jgi:SPP1 family predicted phage head-tail adaptor
MRAGPLDRLVSLQHLVLTRNGTTGEEVESYAEYDQVWAGKRDLRGREFFAAQQVNADTTTIWQIRYRSDVVATDRLVADGISYSLAGPPSEIGRRDGLELQCTAVRP